MFLVLGRSSSTLPQVVVRAPARIHDYQGSMYWYRFYIPYLGRILVLVDARLLPSDEYHGFMSPDLQYFWVFPDQCRLCTGGLDVYAYIQT